jgi:hypothetical protein
MKACRESGTRWKRLVSLVPKPIYPQERYPVSIDEEAVWSLELVWTLWRKKKNPFLLMGLEIWIFQPIA